MRTLYLHGLCLCSIMLAATPLAAQGNGGFAGQGNICGDPTYGRTQQAMQACAEQARQRALEQQRLQEMRQQRQQRAQQIVDEDRRKQQLNTQRFLESQRQQQQQQQNLANQRQSQLNAQVRSSGAVSVSPHPGWNNRPEYRLSNNTDANLRVVISYVLRGANGAYYSGTESTVVGPRRDSTGSFWPGPVDTSKQWNIQITNTRWEQM